MIPPLPFQKGEMKVRDFLFEGRLKGWDFIFSTPHLSPLFDRGGEETPAASVAKIHTDRMSADARATLYSSTGLGRGEEMVTCVILSSGAPLPSIPLTEVAPDAWIDKS